MHSSAAPPNLLQRLFSAALPSHCALCGMSSVAQLCESCTEHYLRRPASRCQQCANVLPYTGNAPDHAATTCGQCLANPPAFDTTIVAVDYAAPLDQLVLSLKFSGKLALAPAFSQELLHAFRHTPGVAAPDLLTVVPLGPQRLAERGFNQALEIARPLAKQLRVPLMPKLLARQRDTLPQSSLHPDARRKNIRRAFSLSADAAQQIKDKHIGVIDDVMTTGETLNELAATLKRAGATRVTNIVFARAPL